MKLPALTIRIWLLACLTIVGAMLALPKHSLFAQDEPAVTVQTETAQDQEALEVSTTGDRSLIDMFHAGGWAMYPLLLLSISGFGLIIFNFLSIKSGSFWDDSVIDELDKSLQASDVDRARQLCEENVAPVTTIVQAGLRRVDVDAYNPQPIKDAVEESSSEELATPFVYINYLSIVGTLSPMVGLLGTVSGMVKAFNAIAAEGVGNPQALADNISEALITTATGMIIGIPAMFFFFFFKNRYGKITARIGRIVGDLFFSLETAVKKKR
jgi:biopolymer transport protein ExbB